MLFKSLLIFFLFSSYLTFGQKTSFLDLNLRISPTALKHDGFSPFIKTGTTKGVSFRYTKSQKRPFFILLNFNAATLNGNIDNGKVFYELKDFELSFAKLYPVKPKWYLGPCIGLIDGIFANSPYFNNNILHDASIPSLKLYSLFKGNLSNAFQLEHHFYIDLVGIHSRNEYSNRPSQKFRLAFPNAYTNVVNNFIFVYKTAVKTDITFVYRFALLSDHIVGLDMIQHGAEIGLRFHFLKIATDENKI